MIALWILGILLAVIVLILLLRVGVTIRWGEKLYVSACAGPIKLQLVPKPEKTKKKKSKNKPKKKTAKKKSTGEAKKEQPKKKKKKLDLTFDDVRAAVPALFDSLERGLRKTRKRLRIHPMSICAIFGNEDPVKVAEIYGWTCAAMWTIMPRLEELVRMPDPQIHLDMDFDNPKTQTEGSLGLSFQIRDLFAIGFAFAWPLLKWLMAFKKAKTAREKLAKQEKTSETAANQNEEKS